MRLEKFSTTGFPLNERPLAWQQAVGRLAGVAFGTSPLGDEPFNASMTAFVGRRLRFSAYTFSPHVTTSILRSGTGRHFILSYLKEGRAFVEQGGRAASLNAGDIVLFDPIRPLRIEAAMRVHSFDIGCEQMKAILPQVDGLTAIALKSDHGSGRLLRSLLDELIDTAINLSDDTSDRIADAIPHLVAASLTALPQISHSVAARSETGHRERIRQFVRGNLSDPDLDPEMVAEGVGLSLRHVHQLFNDGPTTLMRWIWTQRLQRCREELANPSLKHRSIGEIAYGWGFNSQAHFCRMFRADAGCSPRDFRRRSLSS
jgi:AraC family transcriptional activator of tynA and feaB